MRRFAGIGVVAMLLGAGLALAADAPKPSPEAQKLGYFVGKWTSEGTVKENPMMPSGKFKMKDTCEWFEGGFAVVCNSEGKGPMGATKGIGIMSYSAEDKAYTYYGVDNLGMVMSTIPKGTVEGSTWTYTDESKMNGTPMKSRYVITQTSDKAYDFKWEFQGQDGSWMTIVEGKSKRG